MKYLNGNILCLTYDELVPVIMPKGTYDSCKSRGNITIHGRGGNGREVLVEYESLPFKYKKAVQDQYGNPYEFMAKQPILDMIQMDHKAQEFYTGYVLPNSMKLPEEYIQKYTQGASWLNTIGLLTTDKRALKESLNVPVGAFWELITDLIRVKKVALPTSYKRLNEKLKQYKAESYSALVEAWRFGNDNSKKVKDEVAEALLIQMIAHPHQHDDTVIAAKYNEWAIANGREQITAGAVGYRRQKNAHLVTQGREGNSKNYNKYSKQIHRDRPSAPLLLINSDDNVLDLYFMQDKNPYKRPALYVVMDAYNDYILGYAIGETVTIELVKAAYRNAMHHVMQLTGGAYCWNQIQTDRWSIGKDSELTKFFKAQAHFTPATAKAAQGKYIERAFGTTWHQNLKMFPNYSGHNITAKERINPDAIDKSKKDFPLWENATQVVDGFITMMRQTVNPKTGKPRQQEWVDAFWASEKSQQRLLSNEVRLGLFGIQHNYSNKLTAGGLKVTINKQPFTYDIPEEYYLDHVGKKVNAIYDPYDMSQVLITDGNGLRFIAKEYENMPAALADFKEGDRARFNNLIEEKKRIMGKIGQATQDRAEVLQRAQIDAASMLQAGVLVKEIRHQAEKAVVRQLSAHNDDDDEISIYQLMR